jgi:two-component system, chemotaxis family, CheB/CheR fusion protein
VEANRANEATERALLAERILAEQDERRRLSELIHDGPAQHLSAIAQTVDAALEAMRAGETHRADELLTRGLKLAREAAHDLRALCDDLEPRALRELGFADAVAGLARRVAARREIEVTLDIAHANELGEHAQLGLYQIVREAIDQAVRRGALTKIEVSVQPTINGGAALAVTDDGPPERRSAVLEMLAERAATLNARFTSEAKWPRGSTIRVEVPPTAARR